MTQASACPLASRTMKHSSCSSIDQGGGKRRGGGVRERPGFTPGRDAHRGGGTVKVVAQAGSREFTLVGIAKYGDISSLAPAIEKLARA